MGLAVGSGKPDKNGNQVYVVVETFAQGNFEARVHIRPKGTFSIDHFEKLSSSDIVSFVLEFRELTDGYIFSGNSYSLYKVVENMDGKGIALLKQFLLDRDFSVYTLCSCLTRLDKEVFDKIYSLSEEERLGFLQCARV